MKKYLSIIIVAAFTSISIGQNRIDEKGKETEESSIEKSASILDRAGGIHNASNIGLFIENRGKLYPRRLTQGPSGEFPINSTKHYVYRINPMVGIKGNVIQGRYTTNEEWEAAFGYHNRDLALIAFSDNPETWNPKLGWPLKDSEGNPIIKSDQDSYAVYNDSGNTKKILGIEVHQIGYAYGVKFVQNMIFFTFKIINKSTNNYSGLYFDLYTDMDVGNVSEGDPEYEDDKVGFTPDKQLVYFYDDGISNEWPGGKTGLMGVAFLKTPQVNGIQPGITDFHYNQYNDDIDLDSVQYGIMSGDPNLYNSSIGPRYFHPGTAGSVHFDDPATLPASGIDLLANICSGPYTLNSGDTLTFITALVAGETYEELIAAVDQAYLAMNRNFELAKPPVRPTLSGIGKDRKAILFWDDLAERSIDPFSGEQDFEGYRIYRTRDKGVNWTQLAEFDLVNTTGANRGIQYSFTDTTVTNGFEYWYTITAFDRGSEDIASLESPKGNTIDAINTVTITPSSDAIGREQPSSEPAAYTGTDPTPTNYVLSVNPIDKETLAGNEYEVGFSYVGKKEKGDLSTRISYTITDSLKTNPIKYGIEFTSSSNFNILNLSTGELIGREDGYNYPTGGRSLVIPGHNINIQMFDSAGTPAEKRPEKGDLITLSFAVYAVNSAGDTLIHPRPVSFGKDQATADGVIFSLNAPQIINSVSRIGGTDNVDITFTVQKESAVKNNLYIATVEGNGRDASNTPFVSLSIRDTGLVAVYDTLYNLETFTFNGIEGEINFDPSRPPSAGNRFSIETIKPEAPSLKDRFHFRLKGASVDNNIVAKEMNKIKVVPNPYLASSLYEIEYGELRREPLRQIQFINLPPVCTIYIFTVDGDLVKMLHHNSITGTESWNLRSEGGREIAPGVYLYIVKTSFSEYMERFAVIK